jgi:hypothetical protein
VLLLASVSPAFAHGGGHSFGGLGVGAVGGPGFGYGGFTPYTMGVPVAPEGYGYELLPNGITPLATAFRHDGLPSARTVRPEGIVTRLS